METKRNMRQHVSFVGALHIGFGLLGVAGALAIIFGFQFLFELFERNLQSPDAFGFQIFKNHLIGAPGFENTDSAQSGNGHSVLG